MKKESKNYKAPVSRFILLVILSLFLSERMVAQCTEVIPAGCTMCNTAVDMTSACTSCYQPGGGAAAMRTNLEGKGLGPTTSVTISAATFAGVANVRAESINVYDPACTLLGGGPYTSSTFPAATNIQFQDFNDHVTVSISGATISAFLMDHTIKFTVNVYNGANAVIGSREYFFKVTSLIHIVGDPHITTVDGVHYDFQAVGEFTVLKADSTKNFEIQVRQTAVATNGPGNDPYSGLSTCVSLNTAVAARVGTHRVSYQPNINGKPDSTGMQLRVDGKLTELGNNGIDLEGGGRIVKASAGAGIQIEFPDGASLVVTSHWWSHYSVWYLNMSVFNTGASRGISGAMATTKTAPGLASNFPAKSWLPALPDGSSLGPRPQSLHDRFVQLYTTFADAWRVTDQSSLFDYAAGTTTATFTNKNWPAENGETCGIPGQTPLPPIALEVAQQLTSGILDSNMRKNAIFDVMITGEPGFAKAYLVTQQVHAGTTAIKVNVSKDTSNSGEPVTFIAIVSRKFSAGGNALAGSVQFTVDGEKFEQTVNLDAKGQATLTTSSLKGGKHQIAGTFIPRAGGTTFSSSSAEVTHVVVGGGTQIFTQWWFWLLLILILLILILIFRKKKP